MFTPAGPEAPSFSFVGGGLPTVFVRPEASDLLWQLVQASKKLEVSFKGLVELVPRGFLVREIFMPEQICAERATHITPQGDGALVDQLMDRYDAGDEKANPVYLRAWIHSHVNMPARPSFVDDRDLERVAKSLVQSVGDYYLMIIVNQRGHVHVTALWCLQPGLVIRLDGLPFQIAHEPSDRSADAEGLIKQKVVDVSAIVHVFDDVGDGAF